MEILFHPRTALTLFPFHFGWKIRDKKSVSARAQVWKVSSASRLPTHSIFAQLYGCWIIIANTKSGKKPKNLFSEGKWKILVFHPPSVWSHKFLFNRDSKICANKIAEKLRLLSYPPGKISALVRCSVYKFMKFLCFSILCELGSIRK